MAGELSQAQFDALADLLRLRDGSTAKGLAAAVLVDGLSLHDAAQRHDTTYNAALVAINRARRGIELAQAVTQ